MTFKEKLQMEHPEKLDKHCGGGCEGCPCFCGYEETKWCGNTWGANCEDCWNREIPGTESKAEIDAADYINIYTEGHGKGYTEGLNDAWELAEKIWNEMGIHTRDDVFGFEYAIDVMKHLTPQEALAKLKAYEDSKIEVGDVVEFVEAGTIGVATKVCPRGAYICFTDGSCNLYELDNAKKTGKHIDIKSILEQIGE